MNQSTFCDTSMHQTTLWYIRLPFDIYASDYLMTSVSDYHYDTSMHQTTSMTCIWLPMTHLCTWLPYDASDYLMTSIHQTTYDTSMHQTTYDTSMHLTTLWYIYASDHLMTHLCIRLPYDTSMHQTTLTSASDYLDISMH